MAESGISLVIQQRISQRKQQKQQEKPEDPFPTFPSVQKAVIKPGAEHPGQHIGRMLDESGEQDGPHKKQETHRRMGSRKSVPSHAQPMGAPRSAP